MIERIIHPTGTRKLLPAVSQHRASGSLKHLFPFPFAGSDWKESKLDNFEMPRRKKCIAFKRFRDVAQLSPKPTQKTDCVYAHRHPNVVANNKNATKTLIAAVFISLVSESTPQTAISVLNNQPDDTTTRHRHRHHNSTTKRKSSRSINKMFISTHRNASPTRRLRLLWDWAENLKSHEFA